MEKNEREREREKELDGKNEREKEKELDGKKRDTESNTERLFERKKRYGHKFFFGFFTHTTLSFIKRDSCKSANFILYGSTSLAIPQQ